MRQRLGHVLPIYGGKNHADYLRGAAPLLPYRGITGFVDGMLGGGGCTANIGGALGNIPKVAIDTDISIIAFHRAVQQTPYQLMEALEQLEYSKECYEMCLQIIDDFRSGTYYSNVEVAVAVYGSICMARNGMRIKSFRKDVPDDKYAVEANVFLRKQRELDAIKRKMLDRVPYVIHDLHQALENVELIHGSVLEHTHLWERKNWLVVCDVPYLYSKRGVKDEDSRESAGYLDDWKLADHQRFIGDIVAMHTAGKLKSYFWICSNFELVDGKIPLEQLQADPYVKALLPLGWRLVIVQNKYASSILSEKVKKKPKCEVIFMNYHNIVGSWSDYTYFDAQDVFGSR